MKLVKYLAISGFATIGFAQVSVGQVGINIGLGAAPDCPYGYYDSNPYGCAPYGYYGPEWFVGGLFIGAGPWFHGGDGFRGHVNNHMHPEHGYRGAMPARGEQRDASRPLDHVAHFRGNEMRDGRGHVGGDGHGGGHR